MLFNSFEFIFVFLPLVLAGFELARRRGGIVSALAFLLLASVVFYSWWDWRLAGLLVGSILANFTFGRVLARRPSPWLLGLGVAFNLGLLGWFKYANFFLGSLNSLVGTEFSVARMALPLAISFFTFQQISYLVDVKRGIIAEGNLLRYALFVTFFPHLVAGPIVHHSDLLAQFRTPEGMRVSWANLAVGLTTFTLGLFKKVVLADGVAPYADQVFTAAHAGDTVTFVTAWTAVAAFTLQIYFDFSGYSDMAIGLARMFGVRLPLNFNSPYKAANIIEFWRRWHMSLSRFLREYLYLPLGGNRRGPVRRYANLATVMLLGGLWHGASWTFVAWGGLHGFYLMVAHAWQAWRGPQAAPSGLFTRAATTVLTLVAVMVAWVLFRAPDWASAMVILKGMSGVSGVFLPEYYAFIGPIPGITFASAPDAGLYPPLHQLVREAGLFLAVWLLPNTQEWLALAQPSLKHEARPIRGWWARLAWRPSSALGVVAGAVFVVGIAQLLIKSGNEFIYFQF